MMRAIITMLLIYLLLSLAVCANGMTDDMGSKDILDSGQSINKGNLLHITVAGHDDLTMDTAVRNDGKISFPLISEVDAAGKMIGELSIEMTKLLSEYIRYPQVSIHFRNTFFVYGEIYRPGEYSLQGYIDVLKAITIAGGFTDFASHRVKIIKSSNKRKDMWINVDKIIKGDEKDRSILVEPGDVIVVPESYF